MRIGIFTELYPPHIGGQEVRYAELADCLLQLGHSVDVHCVRHSAAVPEYEIASGVRVFRYPLAENYKRPLLKPLKRAGIPLLRYSLWVRRMAMPEKYDLMVFNQWPLAHVVFAGKRSRAKIVLDWCEVRQGAFYRTLMKRLPRLSARNVAVSQAVADIVARASGRRVEYLPSGVWVSKYRCESKDRRSGVVYLGRLTEHKNLELLIRSFALMKEAGFSGDLTIAGEGAGLESLVQLANSSGFSACIHFPGFVDEQTKVALLSRSEVLAIPSRREGFPRVVAEAMASGLPVATVDLPDNGTKTVVQDYGIGVVADPTPEGFSAAIAELLRNWDTYSQQSMRHSPELDWPALIDRLLGRNGAANPA